MSKTKELIIMTITVALLILAITTNVFATGAQDLNSLLGDNNTNSSNEYNEISDTNTNVNSTLNDTTNDNAAGTLNDSSNNDVDNNNLEETTIPYTGVNSSLVVIIAICGISSLYAYKKIRDYNV